MNEDLKVGDIVNIYQQPYIEKMLEGKAELIEKVEGFTHIWKVRFLYEYDQEIVERIVIDNSNVSSQELP